MSKQRARLDGIQRYPETWCLLLDNVTSTPPAPDSDERREGRKDVEIAITAESGGIPVLL